MTDYHIPALAKETLELLEINPNGIYADLTFGGGGHSKLILEKLGKKGRLFSFDQDPDAKVMASKIDDKRFTFIESNFRFMRSQLRLHGVKEIDGVLADLGVSSHHFDTAERGFSFRMDARLDMRMNTRSRLTGYDVVNDYDTERLTYIFGEYGEISTPWKVANCIERARANSPIVTTAMLVEAVEPCTPKKEAQRFLSKLYQAIRIEVNGEIEALKMALEQSAKVLKPGGNLAMISYHSLEDRLVKNFMRNGNFTGEHEKDFFGNISSMFDIITRKAVVPTDEEVAENPRSRSAKLRVAKKR